MAKYKSLVISSRVVHAGKRRYCQHNRKHVITKGEFCFEVREGMKWKGYCRECAVAMVFEAEQDVNKLKGSIGGVHLGSRASRAEATTRPT